MKRRAEDITQITQPNKRRETFSQERADSLERLKSVVHILRTVVIPVTRLQVDINLAEALFPFRVELFQRGITIYEMVIGGCLHTLQWFAKEYTDMFTVDVRADAMIAGCGSNQLRTVQWLYNTYNDMKHQPLLYLQTACSAGHLDITKWVTRTFDVKCDRPVKLFIRACMNGHLTTAKWILDYFHIDSKLILKHQNLLPNVCNYNHLYVASWLHATFPELSKECNCGTYSFAFTNAAKANNLTLMIFIYDVIHIEYWNANVLTTAYKLGNSDMLVWLLSILPPPNYHSGYIIDTINLMIRHKNIEMLHCLLSHLTKDHWDAIEDHLYSFLQLICESANDDTRMIECFFDHCKSTPRTVIQIIKYALHCGSPKLASYLVDRFCVTPQHFADNADIVDVILDACTAPRVDSLMWLDKFLGTTDKSVYQVRVVRAHVPGHFTPEIEDWLNKHME